MDSSGSQKLRIKIGNAEFDADGPVGLVGEQFERFLTVIEKMNPSTLAPAPVAAPSLPRITAPIVLTGHTVSDRPDTPGAADAPEGSSLQVTPVGDDIMTRIFKREADSVSLLALPRSDDGGADALVVLLYGYQRLMNRSAVNGYTLIRAAKQSGVSIPRVDTVIAKRKDYVLAAGNKRGRVYSLNNRGVQYAEGVLRRTLE